MSYEERLTSHEISVKFDIPTKKINNIFLKSGLQTSYRNKLGKLCWKLKPETIFKQIGIYEETGKHRADGSFTTEIKWYPKALEYLKGKI